MWTQSESEETGSITLHLLDAAQGHAVQTWRFRDCCRVVIGRATDNDISLVDPQVSRVHVELLFRQDHWMLRSLGRNGTWIDGTAVSEVRMSDRTIFQLGSNGPSFQFVTVNDSVSNLATIDHIDLDALQFLAIDEQRKEEEVQQIAGGDLFKQLQQQARNLKGDRDTEVRQP